MGKEMGKAGPPGALDHGQTVGVFTVRATKKLLDRIGEPPVADPPTPTTSLGDWYATAIFWKPQAALFVNEQTLLPVLTPLAPARDVVERFPTTLGQVLRALHIDAGFIEREAAAMGEYSVAKTASRSVLGVMNDFVRLGGFHHRERDDLHEISLRLAGTPCGPLYSRHVTPEDELRALVDSVRGQ